MAGESKRIREEVKGGKHRRGIRAINEPTLMADASRLGDNGYCHRLYPSPLYRDTSLVVKFNYNKLTVLACACVYPARGGKRREGQVGSTVGAGRVIRVALPHLDTRYPSSR